MYSKLLGDSRLIAPINLYVIHNRDFNIVNQIRLPN